nr:PREDICTED: LOW QUALITY PROTEIN: mas-related G-protein coupled receptor member X2-like [Bos mutus]
MWNLRSLLSAVSTKCYLSALYPIWHCCHCPKHMSAVTGALLWALSLLLRILAGNSYGFLLLVVLASSSLALLARVLCESQQGRLTRLCILLMSSANSVIDFFVDSFKHQRQGRLALKLAFLRALDNTAESLKPTGQARTQEHDIKPMRTSQNLCQSLSAPAVLLKSAEVGSLPMELTTTWSRSQRSRRSVRGRGGSRRVPCANEMNRERNHNAHERPGPPAPTFHT